LACVIFFTVIFCIFIIYSPPMNFLKGSYKLKNKIKKKKLTKEQKLEQEFESNAKKRIGGSMVYVSKDKVNWDLDQ